MGYIRAEIGVLEFDAREWFSDLTDRDRRVDDVLDSGSAGGGLGLYLQLRAPVDSNRSNEAAIDQPRILLGEPAATSATQITYQRDLSTPVETSLVTAAALPVYTNAQIADQLVNGYWESQGYEWAAWDVSEGGNITVNLIGLTADGKALARAALASWSDIIGVNFVEVTSGGQIVFDDSDPSGAYASSSVWGNTITAAEVNVPPSWLDPDGNTSLNDYAYQTYLHEIGHALGLGHGGNYNGSATYPNDALYANDAWSTTLMSYFAQTDNSYFADQGFTFAFAVTPMMADIVAMQMLYGLSTNTRSGDTVYGTGSTADNPVYNATAYPDAAVTIFDTGGTDTLNYSGFSTNQRINLNAETFSNVGLGVGNLAIATGVVIENAVGGSGNDTLIGNDVGNRLEGGLGADSLQGGAGADTLDGGAGGDTLAGGSGNDTFLFETGDGQDTITDLAAGDVIEIRGYTSAQSITADGTSVIVVLSTGDRVTVQNSTLAAVQAALFFADAPPPAGPTAGDDVLEGTSGDDTIDGLGGNDRISGLGGSDLLIGGAGNDRLDGGPQNDTLQGGDGADFLIGGLGHDSLYGGGGNDRLVGGSGDDLMAGGAGDDVYTISSLGDTVVENAEEGFDVVRSVVSSTLAANVERLILVGSANLNGTGNELANFIAGNSGANILSGLAGDDTMNAAAGDDTLYGGAGSDRLKGGTGNDLLQGGAGRDFLYGEGGADTFEFVDGDFAGLTSTSADVIMDFSQADGDTIRLDQIDANTLVSGVQAFQFIGSGSFTNTAGELRYEIVNDNTYIYGDTNGDGVADFMVRVLGSYSMTEGDFVI